MINSFIWVTFQREGIHCYPAALTDPKLQSVSFLGYPHRHIFHFRVELEIFHDDRDVEFIMFKRELEQYVDGMMGFLNNKSCEMIANDLYYHYIKVKYPNRICVVEVSEDNENGCRIYFNEESR
jgi:hypothetical protein